MSANNTSYPKENIPTLRYAAAALAFASQLIHLWALPDQLVAAMLPGILFFLVAACQGFLGASLLFGAGKRTLRFGILVNAFIVFVWMLTRLISVPELFEPLRLPAQGLGAIATAVEVALLVLLFKLRPSLSRNEKGGASDETRRRARSVWHLGRTSLRRSERRGTASTP